MSDLSAGTLFALKKVSAIPLLSRFLRQSYPSFIFTPGCPGVFSLLATRCRAITHFNALGFKGLFASERCAAVGTIYATSSPIRVNHGRGMYRIAVAIQPIASGNKYPMLADLTDTALAGISKTTADSFPQSLIIDIRRLRLLIAFRFKIRHVFSFSVFCPPAS